MTNESLKLNDTGSFFLLKPAGQDYLWGGSRLKDDFGKNLPQTPLAETWECSTHENGLSVVDSGEHAGRTLKNVLKEHPEMLGRHANRNGDIPILIKLIDAKEDLSVQVHPDDEFARTFENGSLGKTEMWYILDAEKDSEIIYGFSRKTTPEEVGESLSDGSFPSLLQHYPIEKNQVYYVSPGTVHAVGKGALIAEVQENSDITYRMYDYDRVDKNGKKRDLHIKKALKILDYEPKSEPRQPIRVLRYTPGCASEILCRCKYFQAERLLINTGDYNKSMNLSALPETFQVLLCIRGRAVMTGCGTEVPVQKGDCVFLPAGKYETVIQGEADFVKVRC